MDNLEKSTNIVKKSRKNKQNVWSLFRAREHKQSLLEREKALCALFLWFYRHMNWKTLSLEEKSITYSPTRASFFCVRQQREKKMFSSAQARSTMIGSSSAVRSTRSSSKVRSTTVRVRAMKGACNLFFSFFLSSAFFFWNVWVFGASARARTRCSERKYDRWSERCIDDRKREMMMTFPYLFSRSRSLPISFLPLMMREREKKAILERETAPLFFRNRSKKKIRLTCALSLSLSLSLAHGVGDRSRFWIGR